MLRLITKVANEISAGSPRCAAAWSAGRHRLSAFGGGACGAAAGAGSAGGTSLSGRASPVAENRRRSCTLNGLSESRSSLAHLCCALRSPHCGGNMPITASRRCTDASPRLAAAPKCDQVRARRLRDGHGCWPEAKSERQETMRRDDNGETCGWRLDADGPLLFARSCRNRAADSRKVGRTPKGVKEAGR